jgi:hypothetical protein
MATPTEVKQYLAYWFQLGKKVRQEIDNGEREYLPQPVLAENSYSRDFEECWQNIIDSNPDRAYLEGTDSSIGELLSSQWDVSPCARCEMPVPVKNAGIADLSCPCEGLDTWPNNDIPRPRSPVNSQQRLRGIRDRVTSFD